MEYFEGNSTFNIIVNRNFHDELFVEFTYRGNMSVQTSPFVFGYVEITYADGTDYNYAYTVADITKIIFR